MRDGELAPGVKLTVAQKLELAQLLEQLGVDVIEVSYPAASAQDFEAIVQVSQVVRQAIVCGLSGAKPHEIEQTATALRSTCRPRIHTYAAVNLPKGSPPYQTLELIKTSVTLARNYCDDVEWSAFDATRSNPDFLCRSIEVAIAAGATTVNIPDSLGVATPETFSDLIAQVIDRVPNIDQAVIAVHCHDDRGLAVDNSLAAVRVGARQVECSINGLGARKGNADLGEIVRSLLQQYPDAIAVNSELLKPASALVAQMTIC
jgi:2-isopropylmalate synthase